MCVCGVLCLSVCVFSVFVSGLLELDVEKSDPWQVCVTDRSVCPQASVRT